MTLKPELFAKTVEGKYQSYGAVDLPDRTWPNAVITKPPIWCSVDLRDGNQSLIDPMDVERKLRMFTTLVQMGYKEIEIGFTSASQTDFDFSRHLIDNNLIPDDVTIQVLTQCRPELIKRSFESVEGARKAIVHLYNSTSTLQRRVVFNQDEDGICQIATNGANWLLDNASQPRYSDTEFLFEYSPESFTGTELDFALRVSNEVTGIWHSAGHEQVIINLPATVEMSTPNIYADQIEWMSRQLDRRDQVILSLHPHNDRGTGVAATELGIMAGADRVEGTLFGNGERTGNVDLITLGMNMVSQGVNSGIAFDNMPELVRVAEECNRLPVHPRHPYGGDLVFTAFSGSHQDAINKGFKAMRETNQQLWEVPYLPVDPADIGRNYEAIIRVNSQSGKGGAAWIMEQNYGLRLPRGLQVEFSAIVQAEAERTSKEISPETLLTLFNSNYLEHDSPYQYHTHSLNTESTKFGQSELIEVKLSTASGKSTVSGSGNGPISAFVDALSNDLNIECHVLAYHQDSIQSGASAQACAFIEVQVGEQHSWGVGQDANTVSASLKAIVSGLNRLQVS